MSFEAITVAEVYVIAFYDARGGLSGLAIPSGTPMTAYTAGGQVPAPIALPATEPLRLEFDDGFLYPGNPDTEEPLDALEAADGIVEIRTYTVREGRREEFVEFFEEHTMRPQAEAGVRVIGQFRSLEDPNVFVWIRAFRNQEERLRATRNFYLGAEWLGELSATAGELIESTEVHILEPTPRSDVR